MADDKHRGGQKQGKEREASGKQRQGTAAPLNKKQPGHAQNPQGREQYRKETR